MPREVPDFRGASRRELKFTPEEAAAIERAEEGNLPEEERLVRPESSLKRDLIQIAVSLLVIILAEKL